MHTQKKTLIFIVNTIIILVLYLLALNLMAFGISLYLNANIGIGSWDVLHNNLTEFYNFKIGSYVFTFGTWVFVVGILTILLSQLIHFNVKSFLAIFTGFLLGKIIDLWLYNFFTFEIENIYIRIILFFMALISLGSGISLLVLTKLPPTPPDVLMVGLMTRFKLNFLISKTITEIFVFIVAVFIGSINQLPFNNLGFGTVLTLIIIGPIVHLFFNLWKKFFDLIDIFKKIIYTLVGIKRE